MADSPLEERLPGTLPGSIHWHHRQPRGRYCLRRPGLCGGVLGPLHARPGPAVRETQKHHSHPRRCGKAGGVCPASRAGGSGLPGCSSEESGPDRLSQLREVPGPGRRAVSHAQEPLGGHDRPASSSSPVRAKKAGRTGTY